ncbi:MAG: hypothetical protein J5495_03755, partial [Bacteroidales bacterium]|nr:hypothetical protein [Bacteroidales bacterium]
TKTYPVTAAPDEVVVKQLGVAGPADYEYLGKLLIYDPGNAIVVPLDSAMNVARRAVSEAGGNYLYVMRLEAPGSIVRANYEIAGKILLAKGDDILTSASPLYEPMVEPRKTYNYMLARDLSRPEGNSVYAEAGFGYILNPIELSSLWTVKYGSISSGFQWKAGYEYVLPGTPWGFGGYTSNFQSRFFVDLNGEEGTYDLRQHQIGPSASWSKTVMKNWYLALRLGLGYAWEIDRFIPDSVDNPYYGVYDNLYGLGQNFDAELSYRFARRFSLGVSLGEMFSYVWGYDRDSGRRYDTEFVVLTLGPTFKIWF